MYDGHCYQLSLNNATWEDAEADCYNKGGHLASVHSLKENNFISQLLPNSTFWLGASDAALEVVTITLINKVGIDKPPLQAVPKYSKSFMLFKPQLCYKSC